MRPKFVAAVLLLALGLFVLMALVERSFRPQPVTLIATGGDDLSPKQQHGSVRAAGNEWAKGGKAGKMKSAVSALTRGANGRPSGDAQPSSEDADTAHEEYVRQRIDELDNLARERGADSLNAILLELENPDREIRKGALDATIEFRDRSSIPRLREIAASTQDPKEKIEILEAIEYLELPTLTEHLAKQQASAGNAKLQYNSSSLSNPLNEKPNTPAPEPPVNP